MNLYRLLPLAAIAFALNAMEEKKSDESFKSSLTSWKVPNQASKQISPSTQNIVDTAMQALLDLPDDKLIDFLENHSDRSSLANSLSPKNALQYPEPCAKFEILCKYFPFKTQEESSHATTEIIWHHTSLKNKIILLQTLQKSLADSQKDHNEIVAALLKGLHSIESEDSDTLPEQLLKYSLENKDIAPNVVKYLVTTFPLCSTSTYFDDFMQTFDNGQSEEDIIEKSAILHNTEVALVKPLDMEKFDEFNESLKNIIAKIEILNFQQQRESSYQWEPDQDLTKRIALLEKIKQKIRPQIEYKDTNLADYFKDKKD